MLRLYSSFGSPEIELLEEVPLESWERLRRNAVRLLEDSGDPNVAAILEHAPFELWSGTNSFNDQFHLLYMRTTTSQYVAYEAEVEAKADLWKYRRIADTVGKLGPDIRFIAVDVDMSAEGEEVASPKLKLTSAVVERALNDAETLIRTNGAVSSIDRIHTAFHGYLTALCDEAGLAYGEDASITELFKLVRTAHPSMSRASTGAKEVDRVLVVRGANTTQYDPRRRQTGYRHEFRKDGEIQASPCFAACADTRRHLRRTTLGAMAVIVDALSPLRNRASVAHPNKDLLEQPEAMLVINTVRTLLHYVNGKVSQ
jgi:hypothetical protein